MDAPGRRRGQGQPRPRGGDGQELPPRGRPQAAADLRGRQPQRQVADHRPQGPRAVLLPLRDGDQGRPRRALPHRAAGRLAAARALRLLVLPGLHARLLQRARGDGARGPRLRRLPRRLHLRRDLPHGQGRHGRARRQGRPRPAGLGPGRRRLRPRGRDARPVPREVLAVPLGRVAAQGPGALPDRDAVGRPRGPGQLRRRRAGRRPAARAPLLQEAPGGRLQGLLRDDALLAAGRRAQPHLPAAAVRAHRRPADHGPAPVPRQPAVRRRDRRAGLRGLRPAAHVPRARAR